MKPHSCICLQRAGATVRRRVYREITSTKQMFACATKLAHGNFLTAMAHANGLRAHSPNERFNIYPCEFCAGLHVGRCKSSVEIDETFEGFLEEQ